jgi:phenylpyruvate tautomerase PptA (4-oxalocrotonate tautomerase family)
MPLIRIDVVRGRSQNELRHLTDTVHEALVETFAAPPRDRYQVVSQHDQDEMILLDTGLGIERSAEGVVLIEITQQGRTKEQKAALYIRLAELLVERKLVNPADLIVSISENTPADWSFGSGRAQFLTGEL